MGIKSNEGFIHEIREASATLLPLLCLPYKHFSFSVLGDYPLRQLTCTDNISNVGFPLLALVSLFLSTFLRSKPELVRSGFSPITIEVLIVLLRVLFVNDHAFRWQISLLNNVQVLDTKPKAKPVSHSHLNRWERSLRSVHLLGPWLRLKKYVQVHVISDRALLAHVNCYLLRLVLAPRVWCGGLLLVSGVLSGVPVVGRAVLRVALFCGSVVFVGGAVSVAARHHHQGDLLCGALRVHLLVHVDAKLLLCVRG
ncbi:hypothetical protein STCU_11796 [Strigomonas culicis]|uniref:Uncharacterized protein n=1 Tax=Strigomonas culicis TaxID=28005 RepID=S9THC2_9TRYP|nr:hypothetical protein STCU_11796 [Strigomonas culicis]|eukprot:EPY15738.1 hypothetical protein STCU_11796 [Strigomonas culicis]